jgi:hypothetical protein
MSWSLGVVWAANAKSELSPFFYIPFFIVLSAFMGSFLIFQGYVAPRALNRWANEQGFKLVQKATVGLLKRSAIRASNIQVVYSIVIIDGSGKTYSGLAKLGAYWLPNLSIDGCPIEVYWDKTKDESGWPEL